MRGGFGGTEPNEYLIGASFAEATKAEGWGGRELRLTTQDEQAKKTSEQPH